MQVYHLSDGEPNPQELPVYCQEGKSTASARQTLQDLHPAELEPLMAGESASVSLD